MKNATLTFILISLLSCNQRIDRAFVDFKGLKGQKIKSDKFALKGYFHSPSSYLPWGEIFDGLYYVRDMYPCAKVK